MPSEVSRQLPIKPSRLKTEQPSTAPVSARMQWSVCSVTYTYLYTCIHGIDCQHTHALTHTYNIQAVNIGLYLYTVGRVNDDCEAPLQWGRTDRCRRYSEIPQNTMLKNKKHAMMQANRNFIAQHVKTNTTGNLPNGNSVSTMSQHGKKSWHIPCISYY